MIGGRWTSYPKYRIRRKLLIMTHGKRGGSLGPVAERYFAAARDLDVAPDGGPPEFFTSAAGEARATAFLEQYGLGSNRPLIALAPGAAHLTKRWPEEHWQELVARLGQGWDVVVLGGKAEERIGCEIADMANGQGVSAAGQFGHDTNAAILKRAKLLVVGDTGLLHLATAVGTPVVGLYGPTVEAFGFFPYNAKASVVQLDLPCRPCSAQGSAQCPLKHHHCMVQLMPEMVLGAVNTPLVLSKARDLQTQPLTNPGGPSPSARDEGTV